MRHFHFKYIRNIIIIFIALVFAGYPYLLVTHYLIPPGLAGIIQSAVIVIILLTSFMAVAYFAHVEHKKREKEEQKLQEEPPSPRGY